MAEYDPNRTQDQRRKPYSNNKMASPVVTWALIGSVISTALGAGMSWATVTSDIVAVEQGSLVRHETAMKAIEVETNMRLLASSNVDENFDELKEEVKEMKRQSQESDEKQMELLRQILRQQGGN